MIVYVVLASYAWEGESSLGVFSTSDLAQVFIDKQRPLATSDDEYVIRPYILDSEEGEID